MYFRVSYHMRFVYLCVNPDLFLRMLSIQNHIFMTKPSVYSHKQNICQAVYNMQLFMSVARTTEVSRAACNGEHQTNASNV